MRIAAVVEVGGRSSLAPAAEEFVRRGEAGDATAALVPGLGAETGDDARVT